MLLPKTVREQHQFNLHDAGELAEYNEILNDPSVTIIEEKMVPMSESQFSEDYNVTKTEMNVFIKIERCTL